VIPVEDSAGFVARLLRQRMSFLTVVGHSCPFGLEVGGQKRAAARQHADFQNAHKGIEYFLNRKNQWLAANKGDIAIPSVLESFTAGPSV
jgi:hypothetical protein